MVKKVKKTDFVPVQDLAGNFVPVPKENISMVVEEKKKRGRPKKYSTPEEARKAKIANTVKGAKKRKGDGIKEIRQLKNRTGLENLQHRLNPEDIDLLIHGNQEEPHSNIPLNELKRLLREQHERGNYNNEVEPLKSIYNELTKRGYGLLFDTIKKVQGKALQAVQAVKNYANVVVNGRNDYPPKVRAILAKEGDKTITGVCINRTPLGKPLMTALQVASGNTFSQKLSNTEYDKLFHLFACIYLGGSNVAIEKNEVINAESSCKKPAGTESKDITSSDIPAGLTLNQALNKTKERMGGKFFTYSAKDNNCQDFIVAFLQANNIGNATDVAWVKQETKVLFEGNDRLRKISNTLTDIGAKVNEITTGAGAGYESDSSTCSSSSSSSSSSSEYGYGINDIDFEDMKWGSFGNQLKQYNKTHSPKLDLHSFAMMILANPKKFNKRTIKRARFYINVILKKGKGVSQSPVVYNFTTGQYEWRNPLNSTNHNFMDYRGMGFVEPPVKLIEQSSILKSGSGRGGMINGNNGNVTPPPIVALTQPQGNSILNAFSLHTPQERLDALQTAVNNIGNDGGFVRGRFETWVSGFSNPQQVLAYMRTYDAIFAWEQDQATDIESVSDEWEGDGLKKGRGGKQSKVVPAEKTSKVAPLPPIEDDEPESEEDVELTQEYIRRSKQKAKTREENRLMANEDKPTPEAELRGMLQKIIKPKKELSKVGDGIKKSNSNIKMPNKWISYVKEYAKTHNLKYNEALKDPKMKAGYKKSGGGMPTQSDEIVAQNYDQKNLGANGRVDLAKYLN